MLGWLHIAIPPMPALFAQLLVGLINGAFYAMLSLGLAVIFGLLNIINFTHGAQYMLGAFVAFFVLNPVMAFASAGDAVAGLGIVVAFLLSIGGWIPAIGNAVTAGFAAAGQVVADIGNHVPSVGYWLALIIAPIIVGLFGMLLERLILRRIYKLDHLYGLLLTFGLALIIEGLFRQEYGSSGQPYMIPRELQGATNLGFMFLPNYRAWVIVASMAVCLTTWFVIERTRLGAYLRAATENPVLVQAFGINVPRMIMLTYGAGVGLAAFAGVLAAPIYQVSPLMGSNIINVVFAVVVIGGMGSIMGAIVGGFTLGLIEGLTKVFYAEASQTVIFVIMALVLLVRPAGFFGRAR